MSDDFGAANKLKNPPRVEASQPPTKPRRRDPELPSLQPIAASRCQTERKPVPLLRGAVVEVGGAAEIHVLGVPAKDTSVHSVVEHRTRDPENFLLPGWREGGRECRNECMSGGKSSWLEDQRLPAVGLATPSRDCQQQHQRHPKKSWVYLDVLQQAVLCHVAEIPAARRILGKERSLNKQKKNTQGLEVGIARWRMARQLGKQAAHARTHATCSAN